MGNRSVRLDTVRNKQDSGSFGSTFANEFRFGDSCKWTSSWCCFDSLRHPVYPELAIEPSQTSSYSLEPSVFDSVEGKATAG